MSRFARIEPSFLHRRRAQARRLAMSTFVLGIVGGSVLGFLIWQNRAQWPASFPQSWTRSRQVLPGELSPNARYSVDVLRVSDGDTFEARVHLDQGRFLITRVRLRGIDAPELSARCAQEFHMAEAAQGALRRMLAEREVSIWNIGPDKYSGRIVADAATRGTPNISSALLAKGVARKYDGGRRDGWC
jgi:endonuclease YncB( thermonuclease family)